jgi:hypothetical protein
MMVKRSFWLVRHQFLAACSQNLMGVTPTKNCQRHDIPRGDGEIMTLHFYRDRIGDIELKGGALDFGKLARLVYQPTQRHSCLLPKKI